VGTPPDSPLDRVDYESTPLTRAEYIAAIVHLYRGELQRANSWRLRLDNTTNWAVLTTAAILTFSFGQGVHSHWILISGLALISIFLLIESRRFRYADVWRARVRMIEENFYGPILRRDPHSPEKAWGALVAEDLFRPRFKISALASIRSRLLRNYWAIYLVMLIAWVVRVAEQPVPAQSWTDIRTRLAGSGLVPWWLPLVIVGAFVISVALLLLLVPRSTSYDLDQWRFEPDRPMGRSDIDM